MRPAPFVQPPLEVRRAAQLRRALVAFTLAMLLATWRLWTPQAIFPRVPLLQTLAALPAALDWLLLGLAVAGLAVAIFSSSARVWPAALRTFAGACLGLILLDQHRLQPWAWQAVLVALALANCPPPRALALVRLLTLSIYLYSGWSKLDYEFLHTLGQQFIAVPLRIVGANPADWPDAWRLAAAGMLPLAEIALAGAFCFRRLWTAALAGSIVLHGLLLVVLGPWGLNHSAAVLLWNAYFIVQNLLLFSGGTTQSSAIGAAESARAAGAPIEPGSGRLANRATQALLVAAMLLPILEPWGLWDAWPSWSLYAPNCERTTVLVQRSATGALGSLEAFVESGAEDEAWARLRIDRWSLAALGAPLYPQNRFQLGVAEALAASPGWARRVRAIELGRADRFSGERAHRDLVGLSEISSAADPFYFNARPDHRFQLAPADAAAGADP